MTFDREHMQADEWKAFFNAYSDSFFNGDIGEDEYRMKLARLGINAKEIDEAVKTNRPGSKR